MIQRARRKAKSRSQPIMISCSPAARNGAEDSDMKIITSAIPTRAARLTRASRKTKKKFATPSEQNSPNRIEWAKGPCTRSTKPSRGWRLALRSSTVRKASETALSGLHPVRNSARAKGKRNAIAQKR